MFIDLKCSHSHIAYKPASKKQKARQTERGVRHEHSVICRELVISRLISCKVLEDFDSSSFGLL